jgi:uncharacterized membrane protein
MDRAVWVRLLLFAHVLGAVVALGFSLSYGLWLSRGEVEGAERRAFALRTVSWIDRRVTTPAYVVQLVTGLALVFLIDASLLRAAWLELSIGLYAAIVILAMAVYAPAYRRQTALAERLAAGEPVEPEYAVAAGRATRFGVLVTLLTVLILFLMVWKPALWSAG